MALGYLLLVPEASFAQQSEPTQAVTGTNRSSTLQDGELSVAVLDKEAIDEARLRDVRRIDDLVPNVQFNEKGQLGGMFVTIRGVGSNPLTINRAAAYIDGIPFREPSNAALRKVESIEVLRGPQAALFGTNSESGGIVIQTREPGRESSAEVRYSSNSADRGHVGSRLRIHHCLDQPPGIR